ncbi:TonB-dependent siderophore receptor [uncultured Salinisphaera sp.]|uniref:TonB-dependent receptor n=1 Tax=uncultured Salinisphaera sp. TaxID=359372 RepID=UPI0032B161A3
MTELRRRARLGRIYAAAGTGSLVSMLALAPALAQENTGSSTESAPTPAAPAGEPVPAGTTAPAAPATPAAGESSPTTTLTTVDVTARMVGGETPPPAFAGGQVAAGGRLGVLGEKNAANVPFSVISYTDQLIRNQASDTVAGALINDASVQTSNGFGNFAETYQIRGFNFDGDDISFGGLYGVLPRQLVQTNFVNRVELFRGANAFAKGVGPGASGVGGAVNIEPKRGTVDPVTRLTFGYESDLQFEQALDVGRRYGAADEYGVRVNIQHEDGETAINDQDAEDVSAAIALDYDGERLHGALDFGYQRQTIDQGRSTVRVGDATSIPAAPDATTNYWPAFSNTELESKFGKISGAFDVTDDWSVYAAFGGNDTDEAGDYGQPILSGPDTPGFNTGDATVSRLTVVRPSQTYSGQAGIRGAVDTGPVSHEINIGYSQYYQRAETAFSFSGSVDTNIYDPADIGQLDTTSQSGNLNDPNLASRTRANGWALSDTAGFFDDRILLTVGGRYQSVSVRNYSAAVGEDGTLSGEPVAGHRVSPVYGLVVKPADWLSLYANHIEALQPGDAAPPTANNPGQTLGILDAQQNEVGAKIDFGRIGGSLAAYQIEKPNAYLDADTGEYGYFGEQRNRGIEANLYGLATERLRVIASATYVDAELTQTPDDAFNGNDAVGVPNYRVALSGDYTLPEAENWHAIARVIQTGEQYADQANDLKLDAWTRIDLGLRYEMPWGNDDKEIIWRANVENVANASYWASARRIAATNYLTQGDPRTFKLSVAFNFD